MTRKSATIPMAKPGMPMLSQLLRREADPKLSKAMLAYRALAAYLTSIKSIADGKSVGAGDLVLSGNNSATLQLTDGPIWAHVDQESSKSTHIGLHKGDSFFAVYRQNSSGKLQRIR